MANQESAKKDIQAFIIGGVFILSLVFATYKYFQKTKESSGVKENGQTSVVEKVKEMLSTSTERDNTSEEDKKIAQETSSETKTDQQLLNTINNWVATDYIQGDIKPGSYTVKSGDTLWEIAEAVYGDGFQWGKILDANKAEIGFLPNGSQALIIPGQVLKLS